MIKLMLFLQYINIRNEKRKKIEQKGTCKIKVNAEVRTGTQPHQPPINSRSQPKSIAKREKESSIGHSKKHLKFLC
jgi:hypothetical protein